MKICFSSAGRIRTIHVTVKISRVAANLWLHIKGDYTCNRELNLNAPEGVLLANAPPTFPPKRLLGAQFLGGVFSSEERRGSSLSEGGNSAPGSGAFLLESHHLNLLVPQKGCE